MFDDEKPCTFLELLIIGYKRVRFLFYVPEPLTDIIGEPDMYIFKGSTINLTCVVRNIPEPPPAIYWTHNSEVSVLQMKVSDKGSKCYIITVSRSFCLVDQKYKTALYSPFRPFVYYSGRSGVFSTY
ncbi:hypothetical protein PR048_026631 [Dryococelus australis]|uniref:Ig-like domain-containing protein n=1 Tax=Dryococelus australis TaxID=614101 RepID=A0ABQ9GLW7_9NEOP|nr:hypothetical protein PR048_026631 [Dryococelus australis]